MEDSYIQTLRLRSRAKQALILKGGEIVIDILRSLLCVARVRVAHCLSLVAFLYRGAHAAD